MAGDRPVTVTGEMNMAVIPAAGVMDTVMMTRDMAIPEIMVAGETRVTMTQVIMALIEVPIQGMAIREIMVEAVA